MGAVRCHPAARRAPIRAQARRRAVHGSHEPYCGGVKAGDAPGTQSVRTAEVIPTPSLGTDPGIGVPLEHGLQSSLVAARLGDRLGVDAGTARDAYYLTLLFYVGCTAGSELEAGAQHREICSVASAPVVVTNHGDCLTLRSGTGLMEHAAPVRANAEDVEVVV